MDESIDISKEETAFVTGLLNKYSVVLPHTDRRVRSVCNPVDDAFMQSGELLPLTTMLERHLLDKNAAGLAANQIGGDRRIIVVRFDQGPLIMMNPVIVKRGGSSRAVERCLSVHEGRHGYLVKRAAKITVEFMAIGDVTSDGIEVQDARGTFDGGAATCIQHEIDHLNGIDITRRGRLAHEEPQTVS